MSCGLSNASSLQSVIPGAVDMDTGVAKASSSPEPQALAASIGLRDTLLYIYTSGTTGLPKAVNVTHFRQLTSCFSCLSGFRRSGITTSSLNGLS